MTIDQFLEKFRELAPKAKWEIRLANYYKLKLIRTEDDYCPICFIAKELGLNPDDSKYFPLLTDVELSDEDIKSLIEAADQENHPLRNQLLESAGLK